MEYDEKRTMELRMTTHTALALKGVKEEIKERTEPNDTNREMSHSIIQLYKRYDKPGNLIATIWIEQSNNT